MKHLKIVVGILTLLLIVGAGFALPNVPTALFTRETPEHLALKISREEIQIYEENGDEIRYWYPSSEDAPTFEGEIMEKRTPTRVVQYLGETKKSEKEIDYHYVATAFMEPQFIQDRNGVWKTALSATTTREVFYKTAWRAAWTAWAANTGFKTTGTVESAGNWTGFTTTNLNTSDDSRASCTATDGTTKSCSGQLSDFSFGLPAGPTIDGVDATIEGGCLTICDAAGNSTQAFLSWNDGTNFTSAKTASFGTSETTETVGGSTDTWGRTWTDSEFANGTFRVKLNAEASRIDEDGEIPGCQGASCYTMHIDQFRIRVYYTESSGVAFWQFEPF